ncbi:MAG: hypothetical protein ACP5VE_01375 [Chthonomonadales bacterium]
MLSDLPSGPAPEPVPLRFFPDRLHAFVFRNWQLVPAGKLAQVIGATKQQVLHLGKAMGLAGPPPITRDQFRRSYVTIIRRNWHLLPYDQLRKLLGWDEARLAYTLREDDFLFIKLGSLKPRCEPIVYQDPDAAAKHREAEIARILHDTLGEGVGRLPKPLFGFVRQLSEPSPKPQRQLLERREEPLRLCYSYFALYGDPLMEPGLDPYPEGYLERLAAVGVNAIWLQGVLYKLAPFPWSPDLSDGYPQRLKRLAALVRRARRHGIRVYLYLNEPRAMPASFFQAHPQLKGTVEGDHAALCVSVPEVSRYLTDSVASICRAVPDLGGFFTITASENLTNCYSHGNASTCPRCSKREPWDVIASVNQAIYQGIRNAGARARLIVWDWGWPDAWAHAIIQRTPPECSLMSVSEWSLPIERGGVRSTVGEYSLSAIGPGPRALRHWAWAREGSMRCVAKIQAANSWEISCVPYVPVLYNVAEHVARIHSAGVEDLMLGWTLGGYPSLNLKVAAQTPEEASNSEEAAHAVLQGIAREYFGPASESVVEAWKEFSTAFQEFPFHIEVVYKAPLQVGAANLLWEAPTGYRATMSGFPYDDLAGWRAVYPPEIFIQQLTKVASGFASAAEHLERALSIHRSSLDPASQERLKELIRMGSVCAIQMGSVARQSRFIVLRDRLLSHTAGTETAGLLAQMEQILREEITAAIRLYQAQIEDPRIGFEATNHYFFIPMDLAEKILCCTDLLERWIPAMRANSSRALSRAAGGR